MNNFNIKLPDDVQFIIHTLQLHGFEAYAVGGCVRDSILGREPGDILCKQAYFIPKGT